MGWDLIVLNIKAGPLRLEEVQDDDVLPLGLRQDVISIIQETFPDADVTDPSWIVVTRPEYSIEFSSGSEDIVDNLALHIHGSAKSVDAISLFAKTSDWSFLDAAIGNFIDFDRGDPGEGFRKWERYKNETP